jgi:hypothetical protein
MSRREAREAERRAQALAERQPHPSGVVDFDATDFHSEFAPDQDFSVGDTQDIWKALTGGRRAEADEDVAAFRAGVPDGLAGAPRDTGSVNGELLDRVRDAVLRRSPEPQAPAAQPPLQQPSAFTAQPAFPPVGEEAPGLTRRQRRERETSDLREDGLPNRLFEDAQRLAPQQPTGFDGYDYEDDGYYDEPYAPEPTIAIPMQPVDLGAPTTSPVGLPQSFAEPTGDDALTFSSPVPTVAAEPRDEWPDAQADAAFVEPQRPAAEPRSAFPGPKPAPAATPFVEPSGAFADHRYDPPSEVTDLAGFEALIRKARQQPAPEQPAAQGPALAWADEEDVQDGFTGLLGRSGQASHGSANALILPNDPQPDMMQALDANGDIFITGSMNLSRSLSTTGAPSELYDSHEIDRLYEAAQDEPAAGVAPVRASKAVSGAPHDRRFAGAPSRRGNVLPTVLAIVAGAMAVGVVTLLVGSWVLKLF